MKPLHGLVTLVRKIRHFKEPVLSNKKFHVTIGHQTVMSSVLFFGRNEIKKLISSQDSQLKFPDVLIDFAQSFEFNEELLQGGKVFSLLQILCML